MYIERKWKQILENFRNKYNIYIKYLNTFNVDHDIIEIVSIYRLNNYN